MDQNIANIIEASAQGAHTGTMNFPTVVENLLSVGVARYHVDFHRAEATYYLGNGESHIVPVPMTDETIAASFSKEGIMAAVLASQTQGQPFPQFLVRAVQAGCVEYIAYLDGQRVVYSGRLGDSHTEYFPGSPFSPVADSA